MEFSPQDDLNLVRSVLAGDPAALEAFVKRMRCIPRFLNVRNGRAGSPLSAGDVDDLAQDVFEAVWRRLSEFRGEGQLSTWVWRFCALHHTAALRRVASDRVEPWEGTVDVLFSHEKETDLDCPLVHDALESLPEDERLVIRGRHFDGRSFGALSKILGVSSGTLKTRYYRGIRRLRRALGPKFEGRENLGREVRS